MKRGVYALCNQSLLIFSHAQAFEHWSFANRSMECLYNQKSVQPATHLHNAKTTAHLRQSACHPFFPIHNHCHTLKYNTV